MNNIFLYFANISIRGLLLLGVGVFFYQFIDPCYFSLFLVFLWSLMTVVKVSLKVDKYTNYKYVMFLMFIVNILYSIYYVIYTRSSEYGIKCIGLYNGSNYKNNLHNYDIIFYDFMNNKRHVSIGRYEPYKGSYGDFLLIYVQNNQGWIISDKPSTIDFEKYKYPVSCISKEIEIGNDSYEYAKYSPDVAYNSFGLNIVLTASTYDSSYVSFYDLKNKIQYIGRNKSNLDTILVYSNINPEFYTGWHICPDSLCTSENYDKVLEGGYGYLFRGKIYSKEETEKYWNIIEQYKLRNANEN